MLHGAGGKARGMTIADAGLLYMNRPGGLKSYDLWRLDRLNDVVGDYLVPDAPEAWGRFKQVRCGGLAPATVERFRAVLQAALNHAAAVERFDAPKLARTGRVPKKKRTRFLSRDQETRLLASYAPHVRPIAEALCFQGLRIGEALRLDWAHIDWAREQPVRCGNQERRPPVSHPPSTGPQSPAPPVGGPRVPGRGPCVSKQGGEAVRRPPPVQAARR
jgi:integrase